MGRVFQIGLGQDGNFAVSNIIETASPAVHRSPFNDAFTTNALGITGQTTIGNHQPTIRPALKFGDLSA